MAAGKRCGHTGCPVILTDGSTRCAQHRRERDRARGSRQARGYDSTHERERAAWQRRLDDGEGIYCADGCGQRIDPTAWQLGHDHVRGGYLGPQTITCNASDGGRRAHL